MTDRSQSTLQDVRFVQTLGAKAIQAGGNVFVISIQIGDVSLSDSRQANGLPGVVADAVAEALSGVSKRQFEADERRTLELEVLEACQWNRKEAAGLLGITERTLHTHINDYRAMGVEVPDNPLKGSRRALPEPELWDVFGGGD